MRSVVVYDSKFGNTEHIAQVIARALSQFGSARAAHVHETAPTQLRDVDLLVFGCPNEPWSGVSPMRVFVIKLPVEVLRGPKAACFDVRAHGIGLLGRFPAAQLARQLRKLQVEVIAAPAGFYVRERRGPLDEGEAERAAEWARGLAAEVLATRSPTG